MEARAKIFKNGRSQAVRLPRDFRFDGDEVKISREGKRIILEPVEKMKWPKAFWKLFRKDDKFDVPGVLPHAPVNLD